MPYRLRLSPGTAASIRDYVRDRFEQGEHGAAVLAIRAHLQTLANNPRKLQQHPAAVRPLYRFMLVMPDEVKRPLQVTFTYDLDEVGITVTSFGPVPM